MPVTISGDGGIAGISSLGGGDFVAGSLTSSGDLIAGPQAVDRATLFVDDSDNSVSINTTVTPAAGVFLQVADGTDPIVSLNNTSNGEVRLGCDAVEGYIGTESNDPFVLTTNGSTKVRVNTDRSIDFLTNTSATVTIGPDSGSAFHAHILNTGGDLILGTQLTTADTILTSRRDLIFRGGSTPTEVLRYDDDLKGGIWNVQSGFETYGDQTGGTLVNTDGKIRANYGNAGTVTYDENGRRIGATGASAITSYFSAPPGWSDATNATEVGGKALLLQRNGSISAGRLSGDQIAEFTLRRYQVENSNNPRTQLDICLRDTDNVYNAISFTANGRIKLPSVSPAGIQFAAYGTGANVDSNTLDDYEEGTFEVTLSSSGGGFVATIGNTTGHYIKIGKQVTCHWYSSTINISNIGSGNARISGLPFIAANTPDLYPVASFSHTTTFTTPTNGGYVSFNNNIIVPTVDDSTTQAQWIAGSPRYIMFSASYIAA